MKIYTKTGDTGETSLYGGQRVAKGNPRLEAYGTVDETDTALGLALIQPGAAAYAELIKKVQVDLMVVGSELATPQGQAISGLELISEQR
ncbi:MAG: ATP:cob(I)alamin adenosyltransferase, partial [Candidatus Kerfeldbacteria bacterium]|nr:ATP:cob(I)alamin adenosyltransferase [Candidatus Kerfeldbacteria bacterium]